VSCVVIYMGSVRLNRVGWVWGWRQMIGVEGKKEGGELSPAAILIFPDTLGGESGSYGGET